MSRDRAMPILKILYGLIIGTLLFVAVAIGAVIWAMFAGRWQFAMAAFAVATCAIAALAFLIRTTVIRLERQVPHDE